MKKVKLSTWAKAHDMSRQTAYSMWRKGELEGEQLESGTILVYLEEESDKVDQRTVAIYSRVSSSQNKDNLEAQSLRLEAYATARGYQIVHSVAEIGSGLNDHRKKLQSLLEKDDYHILLVEHKDRLTRFGFNYLEVLLNKTGKTIEVVNVANDGEEDLMEDLVAVITSFCARLYGQRRSKRKTEKIIKELTSSSDDD